MKTVLCALLFVAIVGCSSDKKPCKCEDSMVAPAPCKCQPVAPCPCPKCPKCHIAPDAKPCPKCPDCPKCETVGEARVVSGEVKEVRAARSPDGGLWVFLKDEKVPYRILASADIFIDGTPRKMGEVVQLIGPATVKVKLTFCKDRAAACKAEFFSK